MELLIWDCHSTNIFTFFMENFVAEEIIFERERKRDKLFLFQLNIKAIFWAVSKSLNSRNCSPPSCLLTWRHLFAAHECVFWLGRVSSICFQTQIQYLRMIFILFYFYWSGEHGLGKHPTIGMWLYFCSVFHRRKICLCLHYLLGYLSTMVEND